MLLFTFPVAIIIGVIISRMYVPKTKSEKIWASILIPLIGGALIHLLVASCKNSGFGFAFDLGSTLLFVAIPEVVLLITLMISLEVGGKKDWSDTSTLKLHYGSGENRVDFEVNLTQKEILQMAKLREQDPEKWKDNELELVKLVKKEVETDGSIKTEKESKDNKPISENNIENVEIENPNKIQNAENDGSPNGQIVEDESLIEPIPNQSDESEEEEEKGCLFGNKLESEYRREAVTSAHWIRQNGTEMCINIDDTTYREMVKLQSEDPKRWVDKELDLFHKAMKMVPNSNMPNKKSSRSQFLIQFVRKLKWYYILASIFGAIITYSVVASVINHNYAECDENQMISLYIYCNTMNFVNCDCTVFRYRMISSQLYRKKIHNKIFSKTKESYDRFEQRLKVSHNLENPFCWLW